MAGAFVMSGRGRCAMAVKVIATYRYADGETVRVKVKAENSYPDALAEAKATAIAGVCELTGLTRHQVQVEEP